MPRKCPRDGLGANPGTPGMSRPDLCVIPHRLDRMSAGQMGHIHGGLAIQMWGCPAEFLCVYWFSFSHSSIRMSHDLMSSEGVGAIIIKPRCPKYILYMHVYSVT